MSVTAPIGTVSFIEKRSVEMVVVVPHDSNNVNDARDRIEKTYVLADKDKLIPSSVVAERIARINEA